MATFERSEDFDGGPSSRPGVLLVHGLNGSLNDMSELAEVFQKAGFVTSNMLLPGHGVHVRDLIGMGWEDWAGAVDQELRTLRAKCGSVFLVGHSLGGALCLHLAANEQVDGIVTMCAPLYLFPWTKPAVSLARRILPLVPTVREDVRDRRARQRYSRDVYRWTPLSPVESLIQFLPTLREELPRVTAPALIMTSRHDHVVPARDGREIYKRLGSREKYLITFHHSYHVIMHDHDREEVLARALTFIQDRYSILSGSLGVEPRPL